MRRLALVGFACAWSAVAAAPVQAQPAGPAVPFVDGRADVWPRGQIGAELGVHTQDAFTAESFLLGGWFRVTPAFALEASLGFVNASGGSRSESTPTNPLLAAYYVGTAERTMFRVGAGVAPGIASDDSADLFVIHWLMRGFRDVALMLPHAVSFVPRFRLDSIVSSAVVLGLDVDLGIHVPTRGGDSEVTAQAGADITARAGGVFQAGLRVQAGGVLTAEGAEDAFQSSLVPYVRAVLGAGYLEARLLLNLDEPGGFAFDHGKIWTLFFGGAWVAGSASEPAPVQQTAALPPWSPPTPAPPTPPPPPPTTSPIDAIFARNLDARRDAILACTNGAAVDVVGAYTADGAVTIALVGPLSGSPAEACVRTAVGPMILDAHGASGVVRHVLPADVVGPPTPTESEAPIAPPPASGTEVPAPPPTPGP